jgi:hypothetical protein
MTLWYHYVLVYGGWIVLGLVAIGGLVNTFRPQRRSRQR